jgi:hypothetical protein
MFTGCAWAFYYHPVPSSFSSKPSLNSGRYSSNNQLNNNILPQTQTFKYKDLKTFFKNFAVQIQDLGLDQYSETEYFDAKMSGIKI